MAEVKIDVYYDGACPFCLASMQRTARMDADSRIHFIDLNQPEAVDAAAGRFTAKDLIDEMHAHLPDGTWRVGYYAWAAIVGQLPGLRGLSKLLLFAPIAGVGRRLYRWFANHRYLASKLLGMPMPCSSSAVCKVPPARPNRTSA